MEYGVHKKSGLPYLPDCGRDLPEDDNNKLPRLNRCNAMRQDGTFCRAFPVKGSVRKCKRHGGANAGSGVVSPMLKHGRTSKYLPQRLMSRYEQMLKDEKQLSLAEEIALIDTRLSEAVEGLSVESGMALWVTLQKLSKTYHRYIRSRHAAKAEKVLQEIFNTIEEGTSEFRQWNEILNLIDHRRKTVESERKRIVETQQVLTAQQAMIMMSALHDVLRKRVDDPKTLRLIANDLDRLFNNPVAEA